jgi:cell wall-associated NlpC family hydrolase
MFTKLAVIAGLIFIATPTPGHTAPEPKAFVIGKTNVADNLIRESKRTKLQTSVTKAITRVNKTSYVFSGSNVNGWDCSGLVRWIYKQAGVVLPHSADKQAHKGKRVGEPKRGDIIAFAYKGSTEFYHVAIYLGEGLMLHADRSSKTTVIEPVANYKTSQIRFIRVL